MSKMKIAAHLIAYNVSRFIPHVLENIGPHVDKIFVAFPSRPWSYNAKSRSEKKNPPTLGMIDSSNWNHKIEIIHGDWERDEDTRNSCLERARNEGFEWLITQDADEFYTDASWDQINVCLKNMPTEINAVRTTWF